MPQQQDPNQSHRVTDALFARLKLPDSCKAALYRFDWALSRELAAYAVLTEALPETNREFAQLGVHLDSLNQAFQAFMESQPWEEKKHAR